MNISIWDLDWYHKWSSIPNITAMKLSSYHQQCGDHINFITEPTHLTLAYDRIYILKEVKRTPYPERALLDSKKTILLGKGWEYYSVSSISKVVAACRPDYLLYETKQRDSYANANLVTFYHNGELLKRQQDFHNTKKYHKKTLVVDDYFWRANDSDLLWCLETLKGEKNVAFLNSIPLARILSQPEVQQKFLELHFSPGTKFKWRNNYGSDVAASRVIVDFLLKLREHTNSNLGFIPIKGITLNHSSGDGLDLDLLRCFQIIHLFKLNKLQCVIIAGDPTTSLYSWVFEQLENWTRTVPKISYIEYITYWTSMRQGIDWADILNSSIKWKDRNIDFLLYLLTSTAWEEQHRLLSAQWGDQELNLNKLDFDSIRKNINLLYKDIK